MIPKLEVSEWSEDASPEGVASKRQRDREAFAAVLSPILKTHPQKLAIIDDIENGNSSAAIFLRQILDGLKIRPARGRPEDKIRNRQFFLFVEAHRVRSKQQPDAKRGRPKKGQSESTKKFAIDDWIRREFEMRGEDMNAADEAVIDAERKKYDKLYHRLLRQKFAPLETTPTLEEIYNIDHYPPTKKT